MSTRYRPRGVGVLGAGGEGLALAAHLAARGESVHLCTRDPGRIAGIARSRSIRARGAVEGDLPLAAVVTDPAELARDCPLIFVATVTTAYPAVAAGLARRAGCPTPMTDALIDVASTLSHVDYRSTGRTQASIGWGGLTQAQIRDVLNR
ncbi:MAG TPA: NAD(P)-binding domain-containing protein [Streptomyces sp.]|nr:NAD(P)-binding domain-containing protein [Streptomyces sp.]